MTQFARPDSDISNDGSWQNEGFGSVLYASIDEATTDDNDYAEANLGGSAETFVVGLTNVTDPTTSALHKVTYRASDSLAADLEITVALKQGATTIASATNTSVSGSATDYTFTLTGTEADNITDYTDLRLSITGDDPNSFGPIATVFQAWFECPDAGGGSNAIPMAMNTYRQMRD